jgi:hypothetical protein
MYRAVLSQEANHACIDLINQPQLRESGPSLEHIFAGIWAVPYNGQQELTKYGLMQAVTRASQDADDYDRASELEQLGGQIIELAPSQWRIIAEARAA